MSQGCFEANEVNTQEELCAGLHKGKEGNSLPGVIRRQRCPSMLYASGTQAAKHRACWTAATADARRRRGRSVNWRNSPG